MQNNKSLSTPLYIQKDHKSKLSDKIRGAVLHHHLDLHSNPKIVLTIEFIHLLHIDQHQMGGNCEAFLHPQVNVIPLNIHMQKQVLTPRLSHALRRGVKGIFFRGVKIIFPEFFPGEK